MAFNSTYLRQAEAKQEQRACSELHVHGVGTGSTPNDRNCGSTLQAEAKQEELAEQAGALQRSKTAAATAAAARTNRAEAPLAQAQAGSKQRAPRGEHREGAAAKAETAAEAALEPTGRVDVGDERGIGDTVVAQVRVEVEISVVAHCPDALLRATIVLTVACTPALFVTESPTHCPMHQCR